MSDKKEANLYKWLYKNMHNWWQIGVEFDWDINEETGKVWVYNDCRGFVLKCQDFKLFDELVRKLRK